MVSIGFRLDNYLAKLDNYPNIRTAKMPSVEIGPFFHMPLVLLWPVVWLLLGLVENNV